MKPLIFVILIFWISIAYAVDFKVSWDDNSDSGLTAGYTVYWGPGMSLSKEAFTNISATITLPSGATSGAIGIKAFSNSSSGRLYSIMSELVPYQTWDGVNFHRPVTPKNGQTKGGFFRGAKY